MDGLWWKTLLKWMIWGYQYSWKHSYPNGEVWDHINPYIYQTWRFSAQPRTNCSFAPHDMHQIRYIRYGQYSILTTSKIQGNPTQNPSIFDSKKPSVKHPLPGNGWMVKNSEPKKMRRKMPTWVTNVKRPRFGSTSWKGPWHHFDIPRFDSQAMKDIHWFITPTKGTRYKTIKGSSLSSSEKKLRKKTLWISIDDCLYCWKSASQFVRGSQLLRQFQKLPHLSAAFPFDIYRSRRLLLRPWRWGLVQPSIHLQSKSHAKHVVILMWMYNFRTKKDMRIAAQAFNEMFFVIVIVMETVCACKPPVVVGWMVALCKPYLLAVPGGVIDGHREITKNCEVELWWQGCILCHQTQRIVCSYTSLEIVCHLRWSMAPCPDIQHTTIYIADQSFIRLPIGDGVACFSEIHWLHTITYNTCKCHRITCKWSHRITSKISKWIPKFNIVVLQLGLAQWFLKCTSCIICAFCGRDTDTQPNHQVLENRSKRHVRVCYGTGKLKTLGL